MTAILELVQRCTDAGLRLAVTDGGLNVKGKLKTASDLVNEIRQHKAELLDYLQTARAIPTMATVSRWWWIRYPSGNALMVSCSPPATLSEILDGRPEGTKAEPLTDEEAAAALIPHGGTAPPPKSGAGGTMATIAETGTAWLPDQPPDHPHHPDRAYFDQHAQRLHAHGKRNDELMAAYVQHWHLAADAEPVAHRKANKGRYAANTWLRNLTRWPSQ